VLAIVGTEATWARVRGEDNLHIRRHDDRSTGPRNADGARLQRLAESLQGRPRKLRGFIEEQHPTVSERHGTRHDMVLAHRAEQGCL